MNPVGSVRPLLQLLVAPQAAFASLRRRPSVGVPLLGVGMLAATLLFMQSLYVETALREGLTVPGGPGSGSSPAWLVWLRLFMVLAAPLGVGLRATALGSILHALQSAAGAACRWKQCVSLVVLLEMVFLVESACTLVLLAIVQPRNLATLQELHLRAGLDLLWHPSSAFLQGLASALNLFVLWWGWLLMEGTAQLTGLSRARAALLTVPLWALAVTLRLLVQPR